jgi:hypothetical protein
MLYFNLNEKGDSMAKNDYINNQKFLEALVEHRKKCRTTEKEGQSPPKLSDYIGECFMAIADHLSRKPNFASYSFREGMVSDGVENCLKYYRNFDETKSTNPFAYFTQIIYYSFLRRIASEKKNLYVKYKATEQVGILDEGSLTTNDQGQMKQFEVYTNISEFIREFEESKKKKKDTKLKGIEKFIYSNTEIALTTTNINEILDNL